MARERKAFQELESEVSSPRVLASHSPYAETRVDVLDIKHKKLLEVAEKKHPSTCPLL